MSKERPCPCGSGKPSWWENDARGIPLARVCEDCRERKLSVYRTEVLTNPSYEADEDIEPEDGMMDDDDGDVGSPSYRRAVYGPDWDAQAEYDDAWGTDNAGDHRIAAFQEFHDHEMETDDEQ